MKKIILIVFLLAVSGGGGGPGPGGTVVTDSIYAWGPEQGTTWEEVENEFVPDARRGGGRGGVSPHKPYDSKWSGGADAPEQGGIFPEDEAGAVGMTRAKRFSSGIERRCGLEIP